jgi:hypothetical protein
VQLGARVTIHKHTYRTRVVVGTPALHHAVVSVPVTAATITIVETMIRESIGSQPLIGRVSLRETE